MLSSARLGFYVPLFRRLADQFIVDFYCKKLRLAIEIDGASHDSENAQIADAERQARLEALGVRFLRFQEREALQETEAVVKAIEMWILQHNDRCGRMPPAQTQIALTLLDTFSIEVDPYTMALLSHILQNDYESGCTSLLWLVFSTFYDRRSRNLQPIPSN
ncbi:MAG: hypothetical protein RLZZ435_177 [Cyanobacteriota bacterium]